MKPSRYGDMKIDALPSLRAQFEVFEDRPGASAG